MAYKMNRLDPENYSEDILRVVEALRLPSGDDPMFQGSSALKVVYPSDYDLAQYVKVQRDMKRDFQAVIRKLMKLRDAHIGDIKSGEIPELKVIPDNTNSRNYNGRRQGFLTKLKQLVDRKYITSKEYSDSVRLLQPDLTELDMFIIKHDIRFEVVRWTPKDILKGFVVYRKHKVDFNTYLFGNNITKIDVVAWVNGIRYSEITMNYKFVGENGLVVNNKGTDVLNEILSEVPYLFYKGKYLKICKRMFSIETLIANTPQLNREPNKLTQRRLYKLFNGDLNLLNQITGDIGNLIYLVDNVEHIDRDRFEYEVDQMKYRLGVITNLRYLKIEPVVAQMLEQLEANVVSLRVLEKLESFIRGFIEGEVKKQMKKWKLLPIPRVYLPSDRIDLEGGGEDMLGEGMNVKIPKQEFIKEHKKLIPLLKKGSQSERQKEAQDQSRELEKVMKGKGQKRKKADKGRRRKANTHQIKKKIMMDDMPPLGENPDIENAYKDTIDEIIAEFVESLSPPPEYPPPEYKKRKREHKYLREQKAQLVQRFIDLFNAFNDMSVIDAIVDSVILTMREYWSDYNFDHEYIQQAISQYVDVMSTDYDLDDDEKDDLTEKLSDEMIELSQELGGNPYEEEEEGQGQALSKRKVAPKKPTSKKAAFDAYAMPETAESISADEKKDIKIHKEIVKIRFEIDDTIDIKKINRLQNKLEKLYTKLTPEGRKEYGLPVMASPAGYVNQARVPSRRTKPTKQRAFAIPMEGREGFHVV